MKRLVITSGEPAGIGPDLALMLTQQDSYDAEIITVGCPQLFSDRAHQLGLSVSIEIVNEQSLNTQPPVQNAKGQLKVLPISTQVKVDAGKLNSANAPYVLTQLDTAINGCMAGLFDAMITAPVQKSVINDAGIAFTGHTEYLAQKTQTAQVVMMLATDELRVALVTTHLPLKDVSEAITAPLLERVCRILNRALQQRFNISSPRILVAGLNPHAGESGHMGTEEIDTITPVINTLNAEGMHLIGPLPADTLFTQKYLKDADCVLAMYHDQGLPVLKYQGFGHATNITLGLPIIRTSVDHGTALDLAGTGEIATGSLHTAMNIALTMTHSKK